LAQSKRLASCLVAIDRISTTNIFELFEQSWHLLDHHQYDLFSAMIYGIAMALRN
jgi:hypothetical protein